MAKIKKKEYLRLPELIERVWSEELPPDVYVGDLKTELDFDNELLVTVLNDDAWYLDPSEYFEVESEVKVGMKTTMPRALVVYQAIDRTGMTMLHSEITAHASIADIVLSEKEYPIVISIYLFDEETLEIEQVWNDKAGLL